MRAPRTGAAAHRRGGAVPAAVALLRRAGGWIVALVALSVAVLALVADPPAVRQVASDPADGAVLAAPPSSVRVQFSGLVHPAELHLTVTRQADGASVTGGPPPALDGQVLTVPVDLDRPGDYLVGHHVRLLDGRESTGVSRFRLTATGPTRAAGPPIASAGAHQHGGDDPLSRGLLIVDLLLIITAATVLLRPARLRGRRRAERVRGAGLA